MQKFFSFVCIFGKKACDLTHQQKSHEYVNVGLPALHPNNHIFLLNKDSFTISSIIS